MCGDRDSTLCVDCVDYGGGRHIPIDLTFDANGDHVKSGRGDFLARNDDGEFLAAREPLGETCGGQMVVVAHRDDVEASSARFRAKIPAGQRAITRKRVHVKITSEDVITAGTRRCSEHGAIADAANDQARREKQKSGIPDEEDCAQSEPRLERNGPASVDSDDAENGGLMEYGADHCTARR